MVQRFLRSVSGIGTGRHRGLPVPAPVAPDRHQPASAPAGPDRHQPAPALTGTDRHQPAPALTGTDRHRLFYDVFDSNFLNIMPIWDI
jgi:hypothetical protein